MNRVLRGIRTLARWGRLLAWLLPSLLGHGEALASAQEGDTDFGAYLAPLSPQAQAVHALWQNLLQAEAGGDAARLAQLLAQRRPAYFEPACERPPQPGDDGRLRDAIATVLMTGLPAHPSAAAEPGGRGRFLACLRHSGAEPLAARLELAVQQGWLSPMQAERPMRCVWQPQGDNPANAYTTGQIVWHSPSTQVMGRVGGVQGQRYAQTFANIWFHEALHLAGIRGHRLLMPAVACCGDEVQDRAAGCAAFDQALALETRLMHLSGPLGQSAVLGPAEALFPPGDVAGLAIHLYESLAREMAGLVEPAQRADCARTQGRQACTRRVAAMARAAVDATLGARCTDLVSGAGETACGRVDAAMRARIATGAATRLMQGL